MNSNTDRKESFINMNSSQNIQQQQINENYNRNENFFNNQQQQQNFYSMGSSTIGHKRQLNEEHLNQEEKENYGIPSNKRQYLDNQKTLFESGNQTTRSIEEEAEDEEEEDEEIEEESGSSGLRSTKTSSSSPECPVKQEPQQNSLFQQHLSSGINIRPNYGQQQLTNIYSTPQQQQQHLISQYSGGYSTSTTSAFPNFGMVSSAPLAHSTPIGHSYNNFDTNTLRNFQQAAFSSYWGHGVVAAAAAAGNSAFPTMRPQIRHYNISGAQSSSSVIGVGSSENFQIGSSSYGGSDYPYNQMFKMESLQQQQLFASPLNNSSSFSTSTIARDSGVGFERIIKDIHKNESSSGGSSEESALSAKTGQSLELVPFEPKFPPYMRNIILEGQKQERDLEEIFFDKPVPARLSLLNNNKKYPITLAEIHRRLNPPECLNTSYLSGILRRAKNKNGGNRLRMDLAKYECGLDLQTGKRKSSQVTTFSTLCEREAIQLAEDLEKSVKDQNNGFPFHYIAMEMKRLSSPQMRNLNIENIKNTMEILREAISIVQIGAAQETLELTEFKNPQQSQIQQQLSTQTLDQFKRFARLSHCFGNRCIIICWQTLLSVFTQYARCLEEDDGNNQQKYQNIDKKPSSSSNI